MRASVIVNVPVLSESFVLVIRAVPPKSPSPSFAGWNDYSTQPLSFGFPASAGGAAAGA